jgi:uncharacterized protein YhaN
MRIRRLELKAFGPFTDRALDFSTARPGFHIVYGPNEAGKSSCLRALKALFFGIPGRTRDSFLHPYDQLMVGGCLLAEDGRELTFYRRKKRKADLFDEHDKPLDSAVLSPFLQGVEQELFESLYGIDHEALVQGGQEILNQKGDVGQAIFAAGSGLTSLAAVLDELDKEAEDIFRPRASTKAVNEALSDYRDLQGKIKQALLSSQVWQEHRRALQGAEKELKEALALRGEKDREKRRLERLHRALPHLSRRRILLEKLAGLGEVVALPADFRDRRKRLEQERNNAAKDRDAAISRLDELQQKKQGISLQEELLNRADEIETLVQRLGEYRKATADRPKLEGMRIRHETEAQALIGLLRPGLTLDQVEALRPGLSKKRTIQNLGARHQALVQSMTRIDRDIRKQEEALRKMREELSRLPSRHDPQGLVQKVRLAQKAGDLDEALKQRRRAQELAEESCQQALTRLGLWRGPLDQAGALPVPMAETLNRFEEELDSLHEKRGKFQSETEQLEEELRTLLTQLHEIRYAGDVPTERDLIQVRSNRDLGWRLLKRQWLEGEDVAEEALAFSPDAPLHETYETFIDLSDQTADRLRREADRVQKHASLKSGIEGLENRLVELKGETQDLEVHMADAWSRWEALWSTCDINPLSPREMRQWLLGFEKLCFQIREAEKAAVETAEKERYRRDLRDALIAQMREMGENQDFPGIELAPVLMHAEALLDQVKGDQAKQDKLESKISDLEDSLRTAGSERRSAQENLNEWQAGWAKALSPLGLSPEVGPMEVIEFIETLQTCFDQLKEAGDLQKRIDGIDRDNRDFQKEVGHLVGMLAPELEKSEVVHAVSELQAKLNRARQDQAVLKQLLEEIETLENKILQARIALKTHEAQAASLLRAAHCEKEEDLDQAEERSNEYVEFKGKLSDVESTLAQIGEGISLADLENQAEKLDPDAVPGQIETLAREIEVRLDPEIQQLSETMGKEKSEMARMDGSGLASELAEASQEVLAGIRRLTERFIRVKLASKVLRDVIESYRAEHQDPVLKIAAGTFRDLTLSSFTDLRTDIDDQGQAILIGVRPDGSWVNVEGMSNGTRDQLYLALRLATLQWRLQSAEPMPFIVDDILINFDDDRSRATLKAMAELGEKIQVILFTHHLRLVESARNMNAQESVFIHEI